MQINQIYSFGALISIICSLQTLENNLNFRISLNGILKLNEVW